ncbi:MAG TPA: hypothetical protein VGZ73_08835 [Bryobacteraceae bacterium]|jgi:hypothetical protein|nr:hypothetical protein [Bryobacteraceae bacterium]
MFRQLQFLAAPAALSLLLTISAPAAAPADSDDAVTFKMVVSAGAKTCVPQGTATVSIRPAGNVEIMDVTVEGLPPKTEFDFFVIQVPKGPFGVSWYQGDIQTDKNGRGHQQFVGRFSKETFAVAPGSAPAPVVFGGPFPDASLNPPFNPIQMYHLGLWFGSPEAAQDAGCPATITPFNGEHNAGIQVLNTSNFADDHGPLRNVNP